MIGMSFTSFMGLLCISVAVALVLHYLVRYRVVEGLDGRCAARSRRQKRLWTNGEEQHKPDEFSDADPTCALVHSRESGSC